MVANKKNIDYFDTCTAESFEYSYENNLEVITQMENVKKKLKAKMIIDAMGRTSIIAKKFNLFETDENHKRFALLTTFDNVYFEEPMFYIGTNYFIGPGYYTLFPITKTKVMFAVFITESLWSKLNGEFDKFIDKFVHHPNFKLQKWFEHASRLDKITAFGPIAFHSKRFTLDRVLLTGDSTGFFDPLTGEGLTQAFITSEWATNCALQYLKTGDWAPAASQYSELVTQYKNECVSYARILQKLLKYPNAFDRFIYSLSKNQMAANWQACAVGNIFPLGERTTDKLKELLIN